jgi:hypothetical protein
MPEDLRIDRKKFIYSTLSDYFKGLKKIVLELQYRPRQNKLSLLFYGYRSKNIPSVYQENTPKDDMSINF